MDLDEIIKDLEHTIEYFKNPKNQVQVGRKYQAEKTLAQLLLYGVGKSFTYKDISEVAEELANQYSSDKKDPVWQDIRQDGIKAIQAFASKHL